MAVKILLVDDHKMFRQGLCSLLEEQSGMEVVGEAEDGARAIQLARELKPDIVVMDIEMPVIDGIEATKKITGESSSTKVIALSMYSNKLFVMDMFEVGASGYLLKECAFKEIVDAINAVLANNIYLCPKIAGVVLGSHIKPSLEAQDSASVLTERECEVLRLLASGKSTKEIAFTLKKSVQSIDMCRRKMMNKLGINDLAHLIKYAIREGLSTLES